MPKDVVTYTITATVPDGSYLESYKALAAGEASARTAVLEMEAAGLLEVRLTHELERQPVPRARKTGNGANAEIHPMSQEELHPAAVDAPMTQAEINDAVNTEFGPPSASHPWAKWYR